MKITRFTINKMEIIVPIYNIQNYHICIGL